MKYYTQWCSNCKKKIGRFEERFLNSIQQSAKCAVCHGVLKVQEVSGGY